MKRKTVASKVRDYTMRSRRKIGGTEHHEKSRNNEETGDKTQEAAFRRLKLPCTPDDPGVISHVVKWVRGELIDFIILCAPFQAVWYLVAMN